MKHHADPTRRVVLVAATIALTCAVTAQAQVQPAIEPTLATRAPDLVVTEIRPDPRLFWGNCNTIHVSVRNQGRMAVLREQDFTVRLSMDTPLETSRHVDMVVRGGLAAGASRTVTFSVDTVSRELTRAIVAQVDALGQISESNERNNFRSLPDEVLAAAVDCPRLPLRR